MGTEATAASTTMVSKTLFALKFPTTEKKHTSSQWCRSSMKCIRCGALLPPSTRNKYCSRTCRNLHTRHAACPERIDLEIMLCKHSTVRIAEIMGVNEKTIRRWIASYTITNRPPAGFWNKQHKKLTLIQVRYIRKSKKSSRDLAMRFGCSPQCIKNVRKYKTYKDVI